MRMRFDEMGFNLMEIDVGFCEMGIKHTELLNLTVSSVIAK